MSIAAIFDAMNRAVSGPDGEALARKAKGVIVFKIDNSIYTADLKTERRVYQGEFKGKPDLVIIVKASDFEALAAGKLKAQAAFMRGKLKIKGNMGLAMKLGAVIEAAKKAGISAAPAAGAAPAAAAPSAAAAAAASSPGTAALGDLEAALKTQGPELVKRVKGVVVFKLTKPDSTWTLDLKTGAGSLKRAEPTGRADITITVADTDFAALAAGKLKPQAAFMRGKLKVKGNMGLAMKLGGVFEAARSSKL